MHPRQGTGSDDSLSSNNSIKPHDSRSVQKTTDTGSVQGTTDTGSVQETTDTGSVQETTDTGSEQEGMIYAFKEQLPLEDKTKGLIKEHLDASRAGAISSLSVDYDFEHIKPLNEVIDQIYKPIRVPYIDREAALGSDDLSCSSEQSGEHDSSEEHSRSSVGSEVPEISDVKRWAKFHKKLQEKIQKWQNDINNV
ncbi:hypothetical protein ccbrp13_16800 [Ktedonobacteria bacterium brp13]|nr:hypothetical protein ccbrp13_16800 [Ktedonobacteria bacterium brp13]